jgi:hypothetical protein
MYKQYKNFKGEVESAIIRTTDGACIPFDPANTCYQTYLKWLEEGNSPLPPDEPVQQNEQPSS